MAVDLQLDVLALAASPERPLSPSLARRIRSIAARVERRIVQWSKRYGFYASSLDVYVEAYVASGVFEKLEALGCAPVGGGAPAPKGLSRPSLCDLLKTVIQLIAEQRCTCYGDYLTEACARGMWPMLLYLEKVPRFHAARPILASAYYYCGGGDQSTLVTVLDPWPADVARCADLVAVADRLVSRVETGETFGDVLRRMAAGRLVEAGAACVVANLCHGFLWGPQESDDVLYCTRMRVAAPGDARRWKKNRRQRARRRRRHGEALEDVRVQLLNRLPKCLVAHIMGWARRG